jgi:tetratricopeptide (TPR) repeat protein
MLHYIKFQLDEKNEAVKLSHRETWGNIDDMAIGLNWMMNKTFDGKRRLWHSGGTFGFSSYCVFYPELHIGIILLSNESDNGAQSALDETAKKIFEELYYSPAFRSSEAFGLSPSINALRIELIKQGFEHVSEVVKDLKKKNSKFKLSENEVNAWGYSLLGKGKTKEALCIFKLNVDLYPESWNVYDSYGEVLLKVNRKEESISMYRKSIELNPGNENGKKIIEQLSKVGNQ